MQEFNVIGERALMIPSQEYFNSLLPMLSRK
jgi:hypothetical protein